MHADHFVSALGQRSQLSDGNRRSIRSQNDLGSCQPVEIAKDFSLDLKFLGGCFDDEVAVCKSSALGHRLDLLQCGGLLFRRNLALHDLAIEILGDGSDPALQKPLLHIAQNYRIAAARKHMRNAVAHGPRSDNAYPLDIHASTSRKEKTLRENV